MLEKRQKQEKIDVKYILKTYWSFLKKHKIVAISLIFLVLIITSINYTTRYLVKIIVDKGALYATKEISSFEFMKITTSIFIIWAILLGTIALLRWFRIDLLNRLEAKLIYELKQRYYSHIVQLSHKFHTTHKTGSLIARLGRGASAMERITDFMIFNTVPLLFDLIISGILLFTIDAKIGFSVLITSTLFIIYSSRLQKIERTRRQLTNNAEDIEKGFTSDTFTNIDSIKYYGKEQYIKQKYANLNEKSNNLRLKEWSIIRWASSGEVLIMAGGGIIVLFLAVRGFIKEAITLGGITFASSLHYSLITSVESFMNGFRGYNRSIADFHDLFQYGKIENDIKDKSDAKELEIKEGVIEFKNVNFQYQENGLFNNFNLIIPKNKKVALVGHSGSGKSTLVKLLYRLYDLKKGEIKIDNINIKDVSQESLRSELSIVPQECILFDDTIFNNILFSNPTASKKEVFQAIKFAQLDKVIANFPYQENTIVGERGVKLSGGEKQRVSIARAILANKQVLVLDEATSSLDSKTEHEIQKDLQHLMKGKTSLIIAHRLSTIMTADTIVVLDKGKIVQQGTHNQLINKPGTYRELWNLQKGGYLGE